MPNSSKHIFIVQDNDKINSVILNYYLYKDVSYRFICFNTAEKSFASLYLNPDIIILDDVLIQMDTAYAFEKIKAHAPRIHLVVLTNKGDENHTSNLIKAGADEYVFKKGHGEAQIMSRIENILGTDRSGGKPLQSKIQMVEM